MLASAALSAVLAYATHAAAARHLDARVILVSLAFLAAAGFLGLHALATPGVLLHGPNTGFTIATPVGLTVASVFAALSVTSIGGPGAAAVLRWRRALLGATLAAVAVWGIVSLAGLPPLDGPLPAREGPGLLAALAIVAVALYGWAAWRTLDLSRARPGPLPLSVAVGLVLLAESMVAVALSRNWHLSWWEWHLLMLAAFAAIALGARIEYTRSGSLAGAFGGLYLGATLARIDRWHAGAIARVVAADERGDPHDEVLARLRREGASTDEVRLIAVAAGELRRLDAAFRPYLPTIIADHVPDEPSVARLGGTEREVSVLFADLSASPCSARPGAPRSSRCSTCTGLAPDEVAEARIVATWLDSHDAPTLDLHRVDAPALQAFLRGHAGEGALKAGGAGDPGLRWAALHRVGQRGQRAGRWSSPPGRSACAIA